jgi:hypothetical protein
MNNISSNQNPLNLEKLKGFENFQRESKNIFVTTIESFFSCTVSFRDNIINYTKINFNIDLISNPARGMYVIDENNIFINCKIYDESKKIYALAGLIITKEKIGLLTNSFKLFNYLENSISKSLTKSYAEGFKNSIQRFNDNLIKETISSYLSKGYYNPSKTIHLIDYFSRLRTTSFEGKFFSTGMILTKISKHTKEIAMKVIETVMQMH